MNVADPRVLQLLRFLGNSNRVYLQTNENYSRQFSLGF